MEPINEQEKLQLTSLVEEIQTLCAARQSGLLSVIAIAKKYELDEESLLKSLSQDLAKTPLEDRRRTKNFFWQRVARLGSKLKQQSSRSQAFAESPKLLPESVDLAMRVEEEQGRLDQFDEAWLNRPADSAKEIKTSAIGVLFPLFLKAVFAFHIAAFILIWIVPEFQEMFEEFELQTPWVFQFMVDAVNTLVKFWFLPVVVGLLFVPMVFRGLWAYGRRLNPFIWEQAILSKPAERRLAIASLRSLGNHIPTRLFAGMKKLPETLGIQKHPQEIIRFDALAKANKLTEPESRLLSSEVSQGVQKWILSQSSSKIAKHTEAAENFWLRALVIVCNILIAATVLLLGMAVFSLLTSLITKLG